VKETIALRAFFKVATLWNLSQGQCAALLAVTPELIDSWTQGSEIVDSDQLVRISHVLAVYAGLHAIFGDAPISDAWVHAPNTDFGAEAPLERMLSGNIHELEEVREYVDRWNA